MDNCKCVIVSTCRRFVLCTTQCMWTLRLFHWWFVVFSVQLYMTNSKLVRYRSGRAICVAHAWFQAGHILEWESCLCGLCLIPGWQYTGVGEQSVWLMPDSKLAIYCSGRAVCVAHALFQAGNILEWEAVCVAHALVQAGNILEWKSSLCAWCLIPGWQYTGVGELSVWLMPDSKLAIYWSGRAVCVAHALFQAGNNNIFIHTF